MSHLIGKTIGPYRVLEQIGVGGMATVYKAYQPGVDRYIALKILPEAHSQDEQFVKRFQREARAVAKLQHPYILPVYDYGEHEGITYLAMRYVDAGTLRERMAKGPLTLDDINHFIGQIGSALDYAHRMGVVHRDVKPSNVLVDEQGNSYLTDFGVAHILNATLQLTALGVGVGTPAYMSPEQGQGLPVDNRSDTYSLGIILYEMATGHVPYEAETPMAVIYKHIHAPLPLPRAIAPELPEPVERVILKALAKAPADRFQTTGELVAALAVASNKVKHDPTQPQNALNPVPQPDTLSSATRRRPGWTTVGGRILMGGLLLVVLVLLGWIVSQVPYRLEIADGQVQLIGPGQATISEGTQAAGVGLASRTSTPSLTPALTATPNPSSTPAPIKTSISLTQSLRVEECAAGLCVVHPNGVSTPLSLGDASSNFWGAGWSPDGSRLVFAACPILEAVNQTCSDFLYIANQDGSNVTLLLKDPPGKWQSPAWSPDGEWIAFESGRGVFLIRPDGSGKQLLAQMPVAWLKRPIAWSPDSQQIAVLVTLQNASTGKADAVWVANRDGSGPVRTIFNSDVPMTDVAWSPDGQSAAVALENGKAYQIDANCDSRSAGCDAASRTEMASIPDYWLSSFFPQWAGEAAQPATLAAPQPSSTAPAQGLRLQECNNGWCMVHPDGASTPLALGNAYTNQAGASWSPDGSHIVFSACPILEAINKACYDFLFIANRDGRNVTLLLNAPPGKWQSPIWSPDGNWIAYAGGPGVSFIRPDGSGNKPLVPVPLAWSKQSIAWSPDSQQIAVLVTLQHASTGEADAVWVFNSDGSGPVHSILNSGVPITKFAWSPDGQSVAVALDNGQAYRIDARCDSKPAGCDASSRTGIASIPDSWLPDFYPQWAGEVPQPVPTATPPP